MKIIERDMLLSKISEWEEKARKEDDPFNKYISIFIAYNIFYNLFKKTIDPEADLTYGDRFRAIEILPLIDDSSLFELLRNDLSVYIAFIPIYRDEFWTKEDEDARRAINVVLENAFEKEDEKTTMEMLLKWLYKVRCNLVHGEKNYNDEKQKKLLMMSSSLLERVLQHAVESYRQLFVLGEGSSFFDL